MKKSVISIILCTILILTTFAACGKKYLTITDKDGVTHLLLTDTDGNTVINSDGNIAVVNTDANGKVVTKKGGEIYTEGLTFPEVVLNSKDNIYETADFQWKLPEEWILGEISLSKKDSNTTVTISNFGTELEWSKAVYDAQQNILKLTDEQREALQPAQPSFSIAGIAQSAKFTMIIPVEDASEESRYMQNYYLNIKGNLYQITVLCDLSEKDQNNFDGLFAFFNVK